MMLPTTFPFWLIRKLKAKVLVDSALAFLRIIIYQRYSCYKLSERRKVQVEDRSLGAGGSSDKRNKPREMVA